MERRTRTLITTFKKLLLPKTIDPKVVYREMKQRKANQKYYYDQHAKPLEKMALGEYVMMRVNDRWKPAEIVAISKNAPRSYIVKKPEGQTYHRNR